MVWVIFDSPVYSPLNPCYTHSVRWLYCKSYSHFPDICTHHSLISSLRCGRYPCKCLSLHFINVCCMFWILAPSMTHFQSRIFLVHVLFIFRLPSNSSPCSWGLGPSSLLLISYSTFSLFSFLTLGYYNKTPYTQWIIKGRTLFLRVLEARKSEMESLADFMLCESLLLASYITTFFLCLHRIEGARELSQGSFIRTLILFMKAVPL